MPGLLFVGSQRGDEGKGRWVDRYMPEYDIGARFNGGDNAGHTVVANGEVYKLHGLPSSIVHPHAKSVIGNGTVINPVRLNKEMDTLRSQGVKISPANLLIDSSAHLILPHHLSGDEIREAGVGRQGSTRSGIAQAYADKSSRIGLRAESINNNIDMLGEFVLAKLLEQREAREEAELKPIDEEAETQKYIESAQLLGAFVTDTSLFLKRELEKRKPAKLLTEGAQAFLLDIDHGMYPYTTSSSTTAGGVATGLGVPPGIIDKTVGVAKAIQSHVGGGPFVTEITDPEVLKRLHGDMTTVDAERGTTTNRVRRLGYLDLPQIKRADYINGTDEMALTKLDWVPRYGHEIKVCVAYKRKGKILEYASNAGYKLEESTPIYESVPGWQEDIQSVRKFRDLPRTAKKYIEFIEDQTGVPITLIGVGPERDQVIVRRNNFMTRALRKLKRSLQSQSRPSWDKRYGIQPTQLWGFK